MRRGSVRRDPLQAHLPTWLKMAFLEASARRRTYTDVGHHLGKHIEDFESDEERVLDENTDAALGRPTAALRRIFASERHSKADLVDVIPPKRRRQVLEGMLCEVGGADCRDCERWHNR